MFRSLLRPARKPSRTHRACAAACEHLEQRVMLSTSSPFSFDDSAGFTGNGVTLNYSAYYNNNQSIKLSTGSGTSPESRTAFYTTPVEVGGGFQTHFVAQMNGSTTGGMTFTIENDPTGANARGSTGSGMGYMQIHNSAAITLNLGNNSTALVTNGGNPQTAAATTLTSAGITLASGDPIQMDIGYAGTTLTVVEKDQTTGSTATQTYTGVNLATLTGSDKAYIGFTGGDSGASPIMTASQWTYTDTSAIANAGVNLTFPSNIFADAMKMSEWVSITNGHLLPSTSLDSNGWMKTDGALAIGGSYGGTFYNNIYGGTYTLTFTGQAAVSIASSLGTVSAITYNASTNISTGTVTLNQAGLQPLNSPLLNFTNTQRTATSGVNTGVTNVQLMMPTSVGSSTSFASTQLFTPGLLAEIENNGISVIRSMAATDAVRADAVTWSDRTLPTYATQVKMYDNSGNLLSYLGNGLAWEYVIALANQTGKDVWINVQMSNDSTYISNLAKLFKYGADASGNPYSSTQTSPVWAPLGKNQKIYVEYANEVWNPNFNETLTNRTNAANDVTAYFNHDGTAAASIGAIIDYDNIAPQSSYNSGSNSYANETILDDRLQAYNLKMVSDSFRAVYGDAAMGALVRPVYAWQYGGDDYGDVTGVDGLATDSLDFINNYYNNADVAAGGTNHVSTAHPVDYYYWGGGGAFYDTTPNATGIDSPVIGNPSFESAGNWNMSAGTSYASGTLANGLTAPDGNTVAAMTGTTSMYQNITYPSNTSLIAAFDVSATSGATGTLVVKRGTTTLWSGTGISSTAFTRIYSTAFAVTQSTSALTFSWSGTGTVYVDDVVIESAKNLDFNDGLTGWTTTGTVGTVLSGSTGPFESGTNAATMLTGSSLQQSMYFSAGQVALSFRDDLQRLSGTVQGKGNFSLTVDGANVPLYGLNDNVYAGTSTATGGGVGAYQTVYSSVLNFSTAGLHTVKLTYTDSAAVNQANVDWLQVSSTTAMFGTTNYTQPVRSIYSVQGDTMVAKRYGLHSVAYEGGTTLGGDAQSPLQLASEQFADSTKISDMARADNALIEDYYSLGGELPVYFQSNGPDHGLVESYLDANLTASGGSAKLSAFNTAMTTAQAALGSRSQQTVTRFAWSAPGTDTINATLYPRPTNVSVLNAHPAMYQYFVNVTTAGYYDVGAALDPSKPVTANLSIDGDLLGSITAGTGSSSGSYRVWLTAGLHAVELLNTSLTTQGLVQTLSVLAAP